MSVPAGRKGDSYKRKNNTKTDGISSACFLTHIGAIKPSGYKGEVVVKGDSGERGAGGESVLFCDGEAILRIGNLTPCILARTHQETYLIDEQDSKIPPFRSW